ncbi:MAG: glycosyltransferase family 4 protein [Dictyoglomaceae bacterium]|nr:glycosyltransferase family 4 protein [Dictyoglomaceae bacterium]
MKIAFFTINYLPNTGGAAIAVETYRKALENLGNEVYVFAPKYPPWFPPYNDSKRVFRYPALFIKSINPHPIPLPFTFFLEDFFRKQNFNIIHTHHPYIIGKTALKLSKKYKIPLVFTYHTLYHKYVHYIPLVPQKIKEKIAIITSINFTNKVDLVIAPSPEIKEMIRKFGTKKRIEVLPTGLDLSLWERVNKEKFLSNKPWRDKKILLYTGRLAKEKNLEFLLNSLAPLLKRREDIVLLIVGDGDERKNLENLRDRLLLRDKVFFLGWFPREKLVDFYTSAHIFVFPSITETQGLVTLEAMAGGCAIVAVDATGTKSIVSDGIDGFLTPLDSTIFSQKVELLLDNPDLLYKMKTNAKLKAQNYSVDVLAKKLQDFYREILKEREK